MGIGDRLAAAQDRSVHFPSLLASPPARSRPMAFRARRSRARRRCCFRCIYRVAEGHTGMDCETQSIGSAGFLITIPHASQVGCYECAAIDKDYLSYAARLSGFLNLAVRTIGDQMAPNLYSEEGGATFTCEFLSVTTFSLAKSDGNASVVGAYHVIQFGVEINSSHVIVTCEPWCSHGSTWYKACCPNKGDRNAEHTLAIGFGGKEDANAKPKGEIMLKSDAIAIAISGRLFDVFKGHLAREKSELMVKHEPTPSWKFCIMLKVEFLDNFRMPRNQTLKVKVMSSVIATPLLNSDRPKFILQFMKDDMILPANLGGSSNVTKKALNDVPIMQSQLAKKCVKSDYPDDKMTFKVPRVKQSLISSKVDAKSGIPGSSLHSTKAGIPLLRACWLWIFVLVILLSPSGVKAAEDDPSFEQGNCRYDLTSLAALSCVQPNSPWQRPSRTCCRALLHAIDHVPPSGDSGTCCLCRYMRAKHPSPKLVRTYVLCKGKDSRTVSKWSSFPIRTCSTACKKRSNSSPDIGASASANKKRPVMHSTSNGIFKILWMAAAAVLLMGMWLIFFWYFWRYKPTVKASEQRRRSPQEGDPRGGRRQSLAHSSTQLKGRRVGTSRASPNS